MSSVRVFEKNIIKKYGRTGRICRDINFDIEIFALFYYCVSLRRRTAVVVVYMAYYYAPLYYNNIIYRLFRNGFRFGRTHVENKTSNSLLIEIIY